MRPLVSIRPKPGQGFKKMDRGFEGEIQEVWGVGYQQTCHDPVFGIGCNTPLQFLGLQYPSPPIPFPIPPPSKDKI